MEKRKYVVLVAGGTGSRMGTEIPKQFLLINGKPVILHTIEAFQAFDDAIEIVVVLPQAQLELWNQLSIVFSKLTQVKIQIGGETRFNSVMNGLSILPEDGFVAIHDAVRSFIKKEIIQKSFQSAIENGNGIAAIHCTDTVRQKTENGYELLDRSKLWLMQTPQVFDLKELKNAYQNAANNSFTDDAAVMQAAGHKLYLVEGDKNNIKITMPEDLQYAEWLLHKKQQPTN